MAKKDLAHRVFAYLRHLFCAWNTTGEGIHSPYLFELVRFVLRDENAYYCFADIERRRELLLACEIWIALRRSTSTEPASMTGCSMATQPI